MATEKEWADSGYQTPGQFRYHDLNGDSILTFFEHSIGIARWLRRNERRTDDRNSAELAATRKRDASTDPSAILVEALETDPQVVARREQVQQ